MLPPLLYKLLLLVTQADPFQNGVLPAAEPGAKSPAGPCGPGVPLAENKA